MPTAIEFWQHRKQSEPITFVVSGNGEEVRELLAEALYNAKPVWHKDVGTATRIVIDWLGEVYSHGLYGSSLHVGYRRTSGNEVIIVNFLLSMVTDMEEYRSRSLSRWVRKWLD